MANLPTMQPRPATPDDIPDLARIHVQAWAETYRGLLSDAEIAARDLPTRLRQWTGVLARGDSVVMILPGVGFGQSGAQRDATYTALWPDQVFALYTLQSAHGTGAGQALFAAIRPTRPFTVEVLSTNARAKAFYEKMGGRVIGQTPSCGGHVDAPSTYYGYPA
jgi:GNAT superfamily N-acetyltransferase